MSNSVLNKLRKKALSPTKNHNGGTTTSTTVIRPSRKSASAVQSDDFIDITDGGETYKCRPQLSSSEDLSFTDSIDYDNPNDRSSHSRHRDVSVPSHDHHDNSKLTSLSGYLEDEKKISASNNNTNGNNTSNTATGMFRRRFFKISSTDVASVGNASDTAVSVTSSQYISGRELHEKAKLHFNAGEFALALPIFESILSAQVRRFSPVHASVGAAMHNVGVSTPPNIDSKSFFIMTYGWCLQILSRTLFFSFFFQNSFLFGGFRYVDND
jgi:hypothetical protein